MSFILKVAIGVAAGIALAGILAAAGFVIYGRRVALRRAVARGWRRYRRTVAFGAIAMSACGVALATDYAYSRHLAGGAAAERVTFVRNMRESGEAPPCGNIYGKTVCGSWDEVSLGTPSRSPLQAVRDALWPWR